MEFKDLIEAAQDALTCRMLSEECVSGEVSAAIESDAGLIYTGLSLSAACGIGWCGETAAVASMLTAGESRIRRVVAINGTGQCMPPCGRCREMLYQINHANLDAEILLEGGKVLRLGDLLPERWQELYE